jgi:hypothetical protein
MASTSLQNLMSHILTVGLGHFIPSKFEHPENLSRGAIKFLDLMKEATGIEMKPVHPYQVIKFDASSYYAYQGTMVDDSSNDVWFQISEGAISCGTQNQVSLHQYEESTNCNGLMLR